MRVICFATVMIVVFGAVTFSNAEQKSTSSTVPAATSAFTLSPLPYARNALEPYLSEKAIDLHYNKHHQGYVDNLNRLTINTDMASLPIEKIIQKTSGNADKKSIFNNAAQVWNHSFFWKSMKQGGSSAPTGKLAEMITTSFGSFDSFKIAFNDAAITLFGSGWTWLIQEGTTLKVVSTSNADTPVAHGQTALIVCDVWEHAYYPDYQNRRKDFIQAFLNHLANWEFAASQLK